MKAFEHQQRSLSSLADVVLWSRRALVILTTGAGGSCAILNETCCFYVNTARQVEENQKVLKDNIEIIQKARKHIALETFWLGFLFASISSSFKAIFLLFITPFIILLLISLLV